MFETDPHFPLVIGITGSVYYPDADPGMWFRTGSAGAGKDTLAETISDLIRGADTYPTGGFVVRTIPLAMRVKETVRTLYDLTIDQVWGTQADKERVDPRWGLSPRQILQCFGTEVGRSVHPDTWTRALHTQIRRAGGVGTHMVLVPDVRFPNEADYIRSVGGILLRVDRHLTGEAPDPIPADVHASEAYNCSDPDLVITNGGDRLDLASELVYLLVQGMVILPGAQKNRTSIQRLIHQFGAPSPKDDYGAGLTYYTCGHCGVEVATQSLPAHEGLRLPHADEEVALTAGVREVIFTSGASVFCREAHRKIPRTPIQAVPAT